MTQIPDLSEELYASELAVGPFRYVSVAWLGAAVSSSGETSGALVARLRQLALQNFVDDLDLGSHRCEICGHAESRGQFFVQDLETRYLLPMMVFHYILDHSYKLPEVVEVAVWRRRDAAHP